VSGWDQQYDFEEWERDMDDRPQAEWTHPWRLAAIVIVSLVLIFGFLRAVLT